MRRDHRRLIVLFVAFAAQPLFAQTAVPGSSAAGNAQVPAIPQTILPPSLRAAILPGDPAGAPGAGGGPHMSANTPYAPSSVTLPPIGAAANDASGKTNPAGNPAADIVPSYHDWTQSLMFPEPNISNLRKLLAYFEAHHRAKAESTGQETAHSEVVEQILEGSASTAKSAEKQIPPYPVYRLSSVLIDPVNGWSVVVNGKPLTPGVAGGELQVMAVRGTSASFVWQPADKLLAMQFAKDDEARRKHTVLPPEEKRVAAVVPEKNVTQSPLSVHFTLHPNQTFLPQWMAIYEGSPSVAPTPYPLAATPAMPPNGALLPPMGPSALALQGSPTMNDLASAQPAARVIPPVSGGVPQNATAALPVTTASAPGTVTGLAALPGAAASSPAAPPGTMTGLAALPGTQSGLAARSTAMADTNQVAVTATPMLNAPATAVETPATPLRSVTEITPAAPGIAPLIVNSPAALPSVNSIP